jgi:hypothetical protein
MDVDTLHVMTQIMDWIQIIMYYVVAFLCGCTAATAELLSRYSDGAKRIFRLNESKIYLALNGFAALTAYAVIKQHGLSGYLGSSPLSQAIVAGLSAMAILRSSVASIKLGQTTIQAGLAPVIQVFLNSVDRAFDRKRSQMNVAEVEEIMKDVDFNKAVKTLPATCLNLMQNVSKEEYEKMAHEVLDLEKGEIIQEAKALNLGIIISRVTGPELLHKAVQSLRNVIHITTQPPSGTGQFQPVNEQEKKIRELKQKFL